MSTVGLCVVCLSRVGYCTSLNVIGPDLCMRVKKLTIWDNLVWVEF